MPRQCQCGGLINQWDVIAGERWECQACGRRETFLHALVPESDLFSDGQQKQLASPENVAIIAES